MISRIVLFGATGDMAGRYLLPALASLQAAHRLPADFSLLGGAIEDWDDDAFRDHVRHRLAEHASRVPESAREALVGSLSYRSVDLTDAASVGAAVHPDRSGAGTHDDPEPIAAYLALPPAVYPTAVGSLAKVGLPAGSRIVLEKPFGTDLQSAIELNRLLRDVPGLGGEEAVFRVDHFLAIATVQNVLAIRLANRIVEPVWNGAHIEQVDINWDETLALEGRAGYFDHAGELVDMIQSHLLQVLALIAMEPPTSLNARDLRDRKVDVLRAVRPPRAEEMASRTRRARYTAGRLADTPDGRGRQVPAYVDEAGVDPRRRSETFAEVVLEVDGWRWAGTRFVLHAAKAMAVDRKEILVRFRPVPRLPFGNRASAPPPPDELHLGLAIDTPAGFVLKLTGTGSGSPPALVPLAMTAQLAASEMPVYGRVILDVLTGDSALSIRGDEAEQAWRLVTPVRKAWAADEVPLEEYPAGSGGPPS